MTLLLLAACNTDHETCDPNGPWTESGAPDGEINGTCAPEDELYTDHFSCDGVAGPCRGTAEQGAVARVDEDPARLEDPDLDWVRSQLGSCSCVCCHNDAGESAHIWSWDFAPVWTDSIETDRLERIVEGYAGHQDDIDPDDNHGFSRDPSGFPSTDGERLLAYFGRELERRE